MTVLSLAPSILVMVTSFTRIVVVLSLLRTALGATGPSNAVIVSLALFLTAFVMGPALQRAYDIGVKPLVANQITAKQAFERGSRPLRGSCRRTYATGSEAIRRHGEGAGARHA